MRCPCCGSKISGRQSFKAVLSTKRLKILQFIAEAANEGRDTEDVAKQFAIKSPISVRTAIHQINKKVRPIKIVSKNNRYFVIGPSSAGPRPLG
jgi:hypothetical protein